MSRTKVHIVFSHKTLCGLWLNGRNQLFGIKVTTKPNEADCKRCIKYFAKAKEFVPGPADYIGAMLP